MEKANEATAVDQPRLVRLPGYVVALVIMKTSHFPFPSFAATTIPMARRAHPLTKHEPKPDKVSRVVTLKSKIMTSA